MDDPSPLSEVNPTRNLSVPIRIEELVDGPGGTENYTYYPTGHKDQ